MRIDISDNENIWVTCEACTDLFQVRRDIAYEMWRKEDEEGIPVTCPVCLHVDGASDVMELGLGYRYGAAPVSVIGTGLRPFWLSVRGCARFGCRYGAAPVLVVGTGLRPFRLSVQNVRFIVRLQTRWVIKITN